MPLAPGAMLTDNLRLERPIGKGAMGTVWLAENLVLRSHVAVKVLQASLAGHGEALARFAQEARGAAQIKSPHVVQVFDAGAAAEGEPYIVMEMLHGEDLGKRIKRAGQLPLADVITIVAHACKALSSAHALGIVHRDIKPENLFLLDAGGEIFVKLLDFGVAKQAGADMGMTTTSAVLGTPYYMSPEQILSPRSVDHRTDLWAVAVVAYHCLVGKVPFDGETVGALGVAINQGKFMPIREWRPELPPAIDGWIQKALANDPAARFQSAKDLADALAAVTGAAPPLGLNGTVAMDPGPAPLQPMAASRASQGHAPPQQTFGPSQQTFGPSQQSYSSSQQISPPSQQGYPSSPQLSPPSQQGYPPSQQISPPSQQGYPPSQQGYPAPSSPMGPVSAQAPSAGQPMAMSYGAPAQAVTNMSSSSAAPVKAQAGSSRLVAAGVIGLLVLGGVGAAMLFILRSPDAKGPSSNDAAAAATAQGAAGARGAAPPRGKPGQTAAVTPPATTTAAPPATAAPVAASSKSADAARAGAISCWKNNEGANKGQAASSASLQISAGPPRSVMVSGPAKAFKGFTACMVSRGASLPLEPGEVVQASVSLPAGPP